MAMVRCGIRRTPVNLQPESGWKSATRGAPCGWPEINRDNKMGFDRLAGALGMLALSASVPLFSGCVALPPLENRSPSTVVTDTGTTRLGQTIAPLVAAHPGKTGFHPLVDGRDAFAARVLMARAAERSIDVQYYIWHKDITGTLLFEALREAADRGVRVRLLLDDNNTSGLDGTLAALDAHPNIEVRLFNPTMTRKQRWVGLLSDFSRLNRRMHNKSFTVDNLATVVGGRNVGDEYFGAAEGVLFVDVDVLAVGEVVQEVSRDFDRYWASDSAYPADRVLSPADKDDLAELAAAAALTEQNMAAAAYVEALLETRIVQALFEGSLVLEWANAQMISDDPAKGLGKAEPGGLLLQKLKPVIGEPASTMDLVSPYFVPAVSGTEWFTTLAKQGVSVRILTNAQEATDVSPVHAGYAKRRKDLLKAGVKLYEMQRQSPASKAKERGRFGSSSGSSLHAKTFAVDQSRAFIGSFNFDPRSAELNTEMGFVIDSPTLARGISETFDNIIPSRAYEVRLTESGKLNWIERDEGKEVVHETEPGTNVLQRGFVQFMTLLPIDWLL